MSPRLALTLLSGVALATAACSTEPPQQPSDVETVSDAQVETEISNDVAVTPDDGPDTTVEDTGVDVGPPDVPVVDVPPPQDPAVCSGTTQDPLQSFGGSCCYTPATHPDNPNCVWYDAEYGEGECMDAQCDSNFCTSASYCTKGCTMHNDGRNNATGEQIPDGIDDSPINDCFPAADGPYGSKFKCVNLRNPASGDPYGLCRPGTSFAQCDSHSDCPAGEVCKVLYVLGEYSGRCMFPHKDGVDGGEPCNSDPN